MCRRLEGLTELTHAKWERWDFEMDDDPTENNTDETQGKIIIDIIIFRYHYHQYYSNNRWWIH